MNLAGQTTSLARLGGALARRLSAARTTLSSFMNLAPNHRRTPKARPKGRRPDGLLRLFCTGVGGALWAWRRRTALRCQWRRRSESDSGFAPIQHRATASDTCARPRPPRAAARAGHTPRQPELKISAKRQPPVRSALTRQLKRTPVPLVTTRQASEHVY